MDGPVDKILAVMNEMVAADPEAAKALATTRVSCNLALADHPTIEVASDKKRTSFEVGLVGVLNGIARAFDRGVTIAASFDDSGTLLRFMVVDLGKGIRHDDQIQPGTE